MTTKDITDLTGYSYKALEQMKQLVQTPLIVQAFPFSENEIDAEIASRSAKVQAGEEESSKEPAKE
jgi:hypothetical protein